LLPLSLWQKSVRCNFCKNYWFNFSLLT
jgi:hypothetical protein